MKREQRGAAVVTAMLVVALGVLLVSGALHRQNVLTRQVENEVAAAQTRWLLVGAIDWVRVILREDAHSSGADHLAEPWAVPLQQTRLDNDGDDPAWLSGAVEDAQARFNLRNVSGPTGLAPGEVAVLERLMAMVGTDRALAERLALRVDAAVSVRHAPEDGVVVAPATIEELPVDDPAERQALLRLRPFITLLPAPTPVNVNTASAEVLAARFENLSLADARRIVASRERVYFRDVNDLLTRVPGVRPAGSMGQIAFGTQHFVVRGRVEFRRARLQALVLLKREGGRVSVIWTREQTI
jgi:general secretion pathway protein K